MTRLTGKRGRVLLLFGWASEAAAQAEAALLGARTNDVFLNEDAFWRNIPETVWNFTIGGYQVLDKYLKSRKGRVLSLDEINHVAAIADSLAFTIEQMARIDEAYRAAFPDRG